MPAVGLGPELPLKLDQAPDHGAIADETCSATTLRRRRDEWIILGLAERLRLAVLGAYDRLFGLELEYLVVDGCSTKAPCGGQTAGSSPVDRRKQGLKRSTVTEANGIPLGAVAAAANCRDHGLLAATWTPWRWSVGCERIHAWGNQDGKLRWCTERRRLVVELWLALANAAIVGGRLVRRAWTCSCWEDRPRRP
jgi:hypothetical protein